MSDGNRISLEKAQKWAKRVYDILAPHCQRCAIVGSVRRKKSDIGDIEIVCIPGETLLLLGDVFERHPDFVAAVNKWEHVKGDALKGKHIQRILPNTGGFKVDIFVATPKNWGWIIALRTGSSAFNRDVILPAIRRRGYTAKDGYIYDYDGKLVVMESETFFFSAIGLDFVMPENRNEAPFKRPCNTLA